MIVTTVGVLTIILGIWLWESEKRRWVRNLGWIVLSLVILQGLLGGLTVFLGLPKPVSVAHACLAELFFSLTVSIAIFTSPRWQREPLMVENSGWPPLRSMTAIATLSQHKDHPELRRAARTLLTLAFFQVFLGIAAYVSRIITSEAVRPAPSMVLWTVLHVATGALTMAASAGLAIQVVRHVCPEESSPAVRRAATLS
jgi:heme A synthase